MRVDDEDGSGQASHLADAAERGVELRDLVVQLRGFLLRQPLELTGVTPRLERLEALDAPLDGLEVRQHPTEPAGVDVVLAGSLRRIGERLLCLLLGADEEHAVATTDRLADEVEGGIQALDRLGQVDDVDAVALGEDVLAHLRVPAPCLVPEVDASFEQLLHAGGSQG